MAPTSQATRESVRQLERQFTLFTGCVDLVALFDWLRPYPFETRIYIHACREMRAEKRMPHARA